MKHLRNFCNGDRLHTWTLACGNLGYLFGTDTSELPSLTLPYLPSMPEPPPIIGKQLLVLSSVLHSFKLG